MALSTLLLCTTLLTTPRTLVAQTSWCVLTAAAPAPLQGAEYKLTVLIVWASEEPQKEKLPPEIEKIIEQLKKRSKKSSFRLEGKPSAETLRAGNPFKVKLPGGYEAVWTLGTDKAKPVHQVLVNPEKQERAVDLNPKQGPFVNSLEKIKKGAETLLLVVQLEPAGKSAGK